MLHGNRQLYSLHKKMSKQDLILQTMNQTINQKKIKQLISNTCRYLVDDGDEKKKKNKAKGTKKCVIK